MLEGGTILCGGGMLASNAIILIFYFIFCNLTGSFKSYHATAVIHFFFFLLEKYHLMVDDKRWQVVLLTLRTEETDLLILDWPAAFFC